MTVPDSGTPIPNPGSPEAVSQGCTCPVVDNGRGKGAREDERGKPLYWIVADCPLHAIPMLDRLLEAVVGDA